jgi:hypothetical protein
MAPVQIRAEIHSLHDIVSWDDPVFILGERTSRESQPAIEEDAQCTRKDDVDN